MNPPSIHSLNYRAVFPLVLEVRPKKSLAKALFSATMGSQSFSWSEMAELVFFVAGYDDVGETITTFLSAMILV